MYPRNGDGFEENIYGGAVPKGYVTPGFPVGGVVVVLCLFYILINIFLGNICM